MDDGKSRFRDLVWSLAVVALVNLAFVAGVYLEKHHWTEEVVGRGYAHKEGDKLFWHDSVHFGHEPP